jgi:hypothetical protein
MLACGLAVAGLLLWTAAGARGAVPSVQVGDGSACNAAHRGYTLTVYVPGHVPPYAVFICTGTGVYWNWVFAYWRA